MAYKPNQRSIPANVLTRAGWLTGTFHIAERSRFVDAMNRPTEFMRLTDVSMRGRFDSLPFLGLQRSAMILIVPPATETQLQWRPEVEPLEKHDVACLLDLGVVYGTVDVLKNVRVSDYFVHKTDFVLLTNARLRVGAPGATNVAEQKQPFVVVNASCVIGVSDTASGADEGGAEAP